MSDISTGTDAYSWVGTGDGSWGDASNWRDVTNPTSPNPAAPGASDPVTIAGTSGAAPLVVSGGGSAASLGVTANVALLGGYTAGALSVGAPSSKVDQYGNTTVSYTAGTLGIGSSSTVAATAVKVVDGTATVSGAGAGLSASGAVTIGTPGNSAYNSTTFTSTSDPGASGTLSIAAGAVFSAASTVAVNSGSLSVAGVDATSGQQSTASLGGDLSLGTAPTLTSYGYTTGGSIGGLSVSGGAKATVAGSIAENYSSFGTNVAVSGKGTSLAATGGLTSTPTATAAACRPPRAPPFASAA
jgi:hypothetical protein